MKHREDWRHSSTILDIDTEWRWVVSSMPRRFHPWGISPKNTYDTGLGKPQKRYGRCRAEKITFPDGKPTPAVKPAARHYTYRRSYPGSAIYNLLLNIMKLNIK
jgi:hypothetical protein